MISAINTKWTLVDPADANIVTVTSQWNWTNNRPHSWVKFKVPKGMCDISIKFKHYEVRVWLGHPPHYGEPSVEVHDLRGERRNRSQRGLRKARKRFVPIVNMWLKSGYKDSMPLEHFMRTVMDKS